MKATPTKLKNGSWGVRIQGSARSGDVVRVEANNGKSWDATIEKVVWSGNGVSICSTLARANSRSSRGYESGERCYYGHTSPKVGCRDCFDTFDC